MQHLVTIQIVSHNEVEISDMILLVFLLEHTMNGAIDWPLDAQQKEKCFILHQEEQHEPLSL